MAPKTRGGESLTLISGDCYHGESRDLRAPHRYPRSPRIRYAELAVRYQTQIVIVNDILWSRNCKNAPSWS